MLNVEDARLAQFVQAAAELVESVRAGGYGAQPGIMREILAGNPDRFPDAASVAQAFTGYLTERTPDEPGRKLMCLNCGSIVVVLMSAADGCPQCGRVPATDLGVMLYLEISEHEYRVLATYADNWARSFGGDSVSYMATILARLTAQPGVPDTLSPEVREVIESRRSV